MTGERKTCAHCNEERPRAEFYRDAKAKDGLQSWCRWCNTNDRRRRLGWDKPGAMATDEEMARFAQSYRAVLGG